MFQNITKDFETQNENNYKKTENKLNIKEILHSALKGQNILLYIIAFMLSLVSGNIGINYSIFAIAIFAATISNGLPTGVLYIVTMIGILLKFQTTGLLSYLLTSFLLVVMVLGFKPRKLLEEYQNEKQKLGKFVFLAVVIGQAIQVIFRQFLIYDLLISITAGITAFIFYKIFSNSIIVINQFLRKKVFSLEEIMGATLMISIAATAIGQTKFLGLQISNIISILLVLILGWKNGILVGTTSGVTVGVVLGIITGSEPILIAAFALSGMIAGILSKFGKLGVIVGFIIGNLVLTYVYNGHLVELIYFKEILVASLALILIPNKLEINIEDLIGKDNYLQEGAHYRLQETTQTIDKLNDVSDVIKQMSNTYKQGANIIDEVDIINNNKEIFIEEFQNNIKNLQENILYEDMISENELIVTDIFNYLNENEKINREALLDIFKNHNNYIIGFDNYDISLKIEKDIRNMINAINDAYHISKLNFAYKAKVTEKNQNVSNQLDGVSKAIESIAKDIEVDFKSDFEKEKKEILSICKQRKIDIMDIEIRKEKSGRYIVKTYLNTCDKARIVECVTSKVAEILSDILKEKIVLQEEKCGIKLEQKICYQTFVSEDKCTVQIGVAKTNKDGEHVSGDSSLKIKLKDGKYLLALSDGMGSGPNARKSSQIAVKMLGRLLSNGFDKETSIELINNTILSDTESETYATLDIVILDLYAQRAEYIKNGAAPTFVKNNKNVDIIKSIALPTGILNNVDLVLYDRDLDDNDIIVMCTDGIIDSNQEYTNKEIWMKNILENIETQNPQKIADIILKEAIDNNYGKAQDDMSIIVAKIKK